MGGTRNGHSFERVDEYDPSSGQWRHRGDMALARRMYTAHSATIGKSVFFARWTVVQLWNGTSDQFEALPNIQTGIANYHLNGAFALNAD